MLCLQSSPPGSTVGFLLLPYSVLYILLSPYLSFISFLYLDLYLLGDDQRELGIVHANQTSICFDPHQK